MLLLHISSCLASAGAGLKQGAFQRHPARAWAAALGNPLPLPVGRGGCQSVKTTGVYCRPSCAARLPRPENINFYKRRGNAEKADFRPCKRCKPDQPSLMRQHAAKVTRACRIIEEAETALGLEELAERIGVSPYYFHRLFKQITGLTPREYAVAHQVKRIKSELGRNGTVTQAIFKCRL